MSKSNKIKLSAGLSLIAGPILSPSRPTAESLKEQIFGAILDTDGCDFDPPDLVRPLVAAYLVLLEQEAELASYADEGDGEVATVSDNEAEMIYREFAIKGWRKAISSKHPDVAKERDDSDVYESCDWYEFDKMTWPTQLIAEVGFIIGVQSGKQALAWESYHESERAKC